jgi:hypothetical protein
MRFVDARDSRFPSNGEPPTVVNPHLSEQYNRLQRARDGSLYWPGSTATVVLQGLLE